MTKPRMIIMLIVCGSMAVFAVQTLSQPGSSTQTEKGGQAECQRKISDTQRQRETAKRQKEQEKEFAQKLKEAAKEGRGPLADRKKKQKQAQERAAEYSKEWQKRNDEAGGLIFEKYALEATEEQWEHIRPKLKKVQELRDRTSSAVGARVVGSSGGGPGASAPGFDWHKNWQDMDPKELTEAQRLVRHLIALVEKKNATPEQLRRTMDALRKARRQEVELQAQLSKAREELREVLTTRQEAALVLMGRL